MGAWVASIVVDKLRAEASRMYPLETGGLLAGYFSDSDVVVTNIVKAGPRASYHRKFYVPDYNSDRKRIGKIYDDSKGRISYLGDWHTHPEDCPSMSDKDVFALQNIAGYPGNYVKQPVMVICVRVGERWHLKAWRIIRGCIETMKVIIT